MKQRTVAATPLHEAFVADLRDVLNKHTGKLDSSEMLALAAYLTGQILALQDQRKMTAERGLAIISANIEAGNAHVISDLRDKPGGRA